MHLIIGTSGVLVLLGSCAQNSSITAELRYDSTHTTLAHNECRKDPPQVDCKDDLEQWMCKLHNNVNARLGKPAFNCVFVRSRWQELDCDTAQACTLTGR